MNPLAKATKYQTLIELRFRNQSKREGVSRGELRELERGERGRSTTTPPSPDRHHHLPTTHTTKHSGIHHTHGYITPTLTSEDWNRVRLPVIAIQGLPIDFEPEDENIAQNQFSVYLDADIGGVGGDSVRGGKERRAEESFTKMKTKTKNNNATILLLR